MNNQPLSKKESKKILRAMLAKYSNGLTVSHKYQVLNVAKKFAEQNNLTFPSEAQSLLTLAAREYLNIALDFYAQTPLNPNIRRHPPEQNVREGYQMSIFEVLP